MKNKSLVHLLLLFLFLPALHSCNEDYVPKPRGFQRLDLPQRAYKEFRSDCHFRCEVPVYSTAAKDDHPMAEPCWFNVFYEPFNATLHLSYKPVHNARELIGLEEDSRTLVYKHTVRADEIYETVIGNKYLNGMLYELNGNTATNFQFYVTDSTHHYLRGSLYFNTATNIDSVAPALEFMKADIIHMLQSLRWED